MPPTRLHQNLLNLAARVTAGEYDAHDGEPRLKDQVMRLWRGADFTPPEAASTATATATHIAEPPAPTIGLFTEPGAPDALPTTPQPEACQNRRRHGSLKSKGETCTCGYNPNPRSTTQ